MATGRRSSTHSQLEHREQLQSWSVDEDAQALRGAHGLSCWRRWAGATPRSREGKDARCDGGQVAAAVSRSSSPVCWMSRGQARAQKLSDGHVERVLTRTLESNGSGHAWSTRDWQGL